MLFDYVHRLKNIFNLLFTEKTEDLIFDNNGVNIHLKQLYHFESERLVKLLDLNEISIAPKPKNTTKRIKEPEKTTGNPWHTSQPTTKIQNYSQNKIFKNLERLENEDKNQRNTKQKPLKTRDNPKILISTSSAVGEDNTRGYQMQ